MTITTHRGRTVVDFRDAATGERVRVRVPDDVAKSPRRAAAFERKVLAGWRPRETAPPKATPTLAEHWPKFLEFQASPANKRPNRPRTLEELQRVFDLYLAIELGGTRLDAITTQVVDTLAAGLAKRELSRATIGNVLGALRRALNVAKRWRLIAEVPEIDASKPKHQNAIDPAHWLTREEAARLVEHVSPTFRTLALFAIRTRLRMGELQALRWSDVDLERGRVHVRRAWSEHSQEYGPTKSGRTRECPLPQGILGEAGEGDDLVFGRVHPTPFAKALRRAAKAAGLGKHVHPHMLRHTFASHCIAAGIPTRVVMSWGGWESEAMLARYAHLAPREIEHWAAMLPGGTG